MCWLGFSRRCIRHNKPYAWCLHRNDDGNVRWSIVPLPPAAELVESKRISTPVFAETTAPDIETEGIGNED